MASNGAKKSSFPLIAALAVLGVAAGGWFFGSPYLTISAIEHDIKKGDQEALAKHIDFVALKEDIRREIVGKMDVGGHEGGTSLSNAASTAMSAMALLMVDPIVNEMISPQGLAAMMGMNNAGQNLGNLGAITGLKIEGKGAQAPDVKNLAIHHQGLNQFSLSVKGHEDNFALIFRRDGLSWRLSGADFGHDGRAE